MHPKLKSFAKEIGLALLLMLVTYQAMTFWRQAHLPDNSVIVLQDIHQNTLHLNQLSEQESILIYFWGSWCHVCKLTTPNVQQLAHHYPVISIAVQSGTTSDVQQYLNQNGYRLTTVNDEHGEIFAQWQGQVTPSYLIIRNGKVQQSFIGLQPLWLLKLRLFWANL